MPGVLPTSTCVEDVEHRCRFCEEPIASGSGVLAVVLFDAVAPGSVTLSLSGAATGPGGTAMGLQFRPVTINVQQ